VVYIVEDEPSVRRTLERMMKRVGFQVRTFAHPLEVLEAFDTLERPALLISDAVMPNMTGFEFLDRTRHKWPGLPTILMSGHAAEERIRETASHGVYFLSKPFTYEGLLRAVQEVRDRSRAAQLS